MPLALRDSLAPAPAACGSGGTCAMHVHGRNRLRPFERSMHRSRCRTACGPAFAGRWPAAPACLVVGDSHVVGGDAQAGPDAVKGRCIGLHALGEDQSQKPATSIATPPLRGTARHRVLRCRASM